MRTRSGLEDTRTVVGAMAESGSIESSRLPLPGRAAVYSMTLWRVSAMDTGASDPPAGDLTSVVGERPTSRWCGYVNSSTKRQWTNHVRALDQALAGRGGRVAQG